MKTDNNQFCNEELSKMDLIQINGGGIWFEWTGRRIGDWLEAISVIHPSFITMH